MIAKVNTYAANKSRMREQKETSSIIFWVLVSFLVLFLFWSPFQRGLFNGGGYDFEKPIYTSLVWISIILLLLGIYSFFKYRLRDHKDALCLFILLIPLSYLISYIPAASHYLAANMIFIQIEYAAFFMLGVIVAGNQIGNSITAGTLMISGYVIVLFGLLFWLGNGSVGDHLVGWFATEAQINNVETYLNAVMSDSNGLRLTAVFQYANSYAAYLMALMLGSLFFIVKSRKWYTVLPHALMMVPMIISFWLTLSRGALVILPFVLLIIAVFLSLTRQVLFFIQIGLSFLASLIILQRITDLGIKLQQQYSPSQSMKGWGLLAVTSFVFAAIAAGLQQFGAPLLDRVLKRIPDRKFTVFVLPVTVIAVGLLAAALLFGDTGVKNLLPNNVKMRIENINVQQHSVLERGTFYKDAIKLWKDYPLIGAGGGAWAALYEKYQNNPYSSRQDHNFFLQYLDETGALGLLVLCALLAAVFYFYIRSYIRDKGEARDRHFLFFIFAFALLVHSMIDFDLSYVYLGVLLFLSLGGMLAGSRLQQLRVHSDSLVVHKLFPAILVVLSVVLFAITTPLLKANYLYRQAIDTARTSHNFNEIVAPLDQALELHPNTPDFVLDASFQPRGGLSKVGLLVQVFNQTKDAKFLDEAQGMMDRMRQAEHHDIHLVEEQYYIYLLKNQSLQAYDYINSQIAEFPWYLDMYEKSIELGTQLGEQALQKKDVKAMDAYWDHSLNMYEEVLHRMDYLKGLPKGQEAGREFDVTPQIALNIGQIHFLRGEYVVVSNLLKQYTQGNLEKPVTRAIDRWYIAALEKQGQNDQTLYDMLIAKASDEKQQIQALVTSGASAMQ